MMTMDTGERMAQLYRARFVGSILLCASGCRDELSQLAMSTTARSGKAEVAHLG